MTEQLFKSIYFSDFQFPQHDRRSFKIAFGKRDLPIFHALTTLSSHEIRTVLQHNSFGDLRSAADAEGLALNTYCLRNLRRWFTSRQDDGGQL
ncbi:MAG: hypothetical protein WA175_09155, partial [Candidatus Acidiferrales bacterium]